MIKTRTGFTIIEAAVVIAIFIVMIGVLTPFVKIIKERAQIIACADHMRVISLGLHAYAASNNGNFPSELSELYPKYVKDPKAFNCPASKITGTPDKPDYKYIAGLTERSLTNMTIVRDLNGNHKDRGSNLLKVGGPVEWSRNSEGKPR
jgi:type II secretory pathway pseudopilin PulG